jgi:hypothetical protein
MQEDLKFEASPGYKARPRLCVKTKQKRQTNRQKKKEERKKRKPAHP